MPPNYLSKFRPPRGPGRTGAKVYTALLALCVFGVALAVLLLVFYR